jgi:hypothetical protein
MAFLIFLPSVPGIDHPRTTPGPIPTTCAHAMRGLKPNNQNANIHLCSVRSRCALRGLRPGSNPLISQSKRVMENEIRSKPQRGRGKAEIHALSTSGMHGWMAYPIANQSSRGISIYMLDIANVCRNRAGAFGRKLTCVTAFIYE